MFLINDIKKRQGGQDFAETLAIKEELMARNPEILDVAEVQAKGNISYENGLYLLTYTLSYQLTLPSSRSMQAVNVADSYIVTEAFVEETDTATLQELVEDDLVLMIEGNQIDLRESVIDNILLNIPLRVLTPKEEAEDVLPSGKNWKVLTQEQYQQEQAEKRREASPFSALSELFSEND